MKPGALSALLPSVVLEAGQRMGRVGGYLKRLRDDPMVTGDYE